MKRLMRPAVPILLVVGALVCLPPATIAAPTRSTDQLKRESIGAPRIHVDSSNGLVDKVMGRFRPQSSDKYRAARSFLERHARAFGMSPDLADLTTAGRTDDVGGTVLRFAQLHGRVPVRDAFLIVGFEPGGEIIHVDNGYVPELDVPARPTAVRSGGGQGCRAGARRRLPSSRDVQLVVAKGDKAHPGYYLAWEVTAVIERPRGDWQLLVDSQTGAVIRSLNRLQPAGPACVAANPATDHESALVFAKSPVDELDNPSLTDADNVDAALTGCKLGNLTSSTDLTGTYANTSLTSSPRTTPPYTSLRSVDQRAVDEATAYYHANRSKEYLNLLGFPDVMNFSIDVDAADPLIGSQRPLFPELEKHRVRHRRRGHRTGPRRRLPRARPRHPGQPDTGLRLVGGGRGLGGGLRRLLGRGADRRRSGNLHGRGLRRRMVRRPVRSVYRRPGKRMPRRVDGAELYPADLEFEVHDDGEIWSPALWRLRAALGGELTDRLVIKSHTFLQPDAGFLDAADALQSADVALFGGAHAAAIDAEMEASGIPRTGTPASSEGLTSAVAFSCGSAHPYANDSYVECSHTVPGATRLRVHFSSFETEEGYDFVRVSDAGYRQVQTLSGTPFAPSGEGFSAAVSGDTIVVRFKADFTITGDGFEIDRIEYAANSAPQANADAYAHYGSDTALSVAAPGVLANDDDDDNDPLTAAKLSNASHGSVTLDADGSFTYQPDENYVGTRLVHLQGRRRRRRLQHGDGGDHGRCRLQRPAGDHHRHEREQQAEGHQRGRRNRRPRRR